MYLHHYFTLHYHSSYKFEKKRLFKRKYLQRILCKNGRRDCPGRDRMVFELTTTCAFSAYHHLSCEFESWRGELDTNLCDKGCQSFAVQVGDFLRFASSIKLTATILLKYC